MSLLKTQCNFQYHCKRYFLKRPELYTLHSNVYEEHSLDEIGLFKSRWSADIYYLINKGGTFLKRMQAKFNIVSL